MHTLVKILAGLTVPSAHLVGDQIGQKRPQPIAKFRVLGGEFDNRKVHDN
jgi:hypothetical protein